MLEDESDQTLTLPIWAAIQVARWKTRRIPRWKRWRLKNKERDKAHRAAYRARNRESILKKDRERKRRKGV